MTDMSADGPPPWRAPSAPPPTAAPPRHVSRWNIWTIVRLVWAAGMLVLLVVVWFVASPGARPSAHQSWTDDLDWAAASHEINETGTQGAPQQQVANGWYTNDLAVIHADQFSAQHAQSAYQSGVASQMVALIGVVALAVAGDLLLRAVPTKAIATDLAVMRTGSDHMPNSRVSPDSSPVNEIRDGRW